MSNQAVSLAFGIQADCLADFGPGFQEMPEGSCLSMRRLGGQHWLGGKNVLAELL